MKYSLLLKLSSPPTPLSYACTVVSSSLCPRGLQAHRDPLQIPQARIMEWVAISSSSGSSQSRDQTHVSWIPGRFFTTEPPAKPLLLHQFSSVIQSCPTLCDPMDCSTPGLPVHHQLPELSQTHVHRVGDAIQPSHPLSSPSPPAFNLSQYQGLFQWVSSSHQVPKALELQLQHHSFQWILRTDFL